MPDQHTDTAADTIRPTTRATPVTPVERLDDPRVVQILSTEHWSLLASRSLAYNEAFIRGGMFLTFLSTSFVALALLAQGMTFGDNFLTVTAIVLAFDLVIGLTTYGRITDANVDDLRAVHGMARIRHAYTEIAPLASRYFTTATHDDPASVVTAYGVGPSSSGAFGQLMYALTTSGGMIGLITGMVGGVLIAVLAMLLGMTGGLVVWIGVAGAIVVFAILAFATFGSVARHEATMTVLFPAPDQAAPPKRG